MTLIVQNESTAGLFISSWLQYPYEFERLERKDGVMVKKKKKYSPLVLEEQQRTYSLRKPVCYHELG